MNNQIQGKMEKAIERVKKDALQWLKERKRTDEEIAEAWASHTINIVQLVLETEKEVAN